MQRQGEEHFSPVKTDYNEVEAHGNCGNLVFVQSCCMQTDANEQNPSTKFKQSNGNWVHLCTELFFSVLMLVCSIFVFKSQICPVDGFAINCHSSKSDGWTNLTQGSTQGFNSWCACKLSLIFWPMKNFFSMVHVGANAVHNFWEISMSHLCKTLPKSQGEMRKS